MMKIIKSEEELKEVFHDDNPMPPGVIDTAGYRNLGFDCGCGDTHGVNDPSIQQIANFRPVKVLFKHHEIVPTIFWGSNPNTVS